MALGDAEVGQVLYDLAIVQHRNSRLYVPFLLAVLEQTTAPKVRAKILEMLHHHMAFPQREKLPETLTLAYVGEVRPGDPKSIEQVRRLAATYPLGIAVAGHAVNVLAILRDAESVDLARRVLKSPNVFERFSGAHALLVFGETDEAVEAFKNIIQSDSDELYYRELSAESLVRLGHREYLHTLVDLAERRAEMGGRNWTIDVLADLTGVYFPTAKGWRDWLIRQSSEPGRRN